MRAGGRGRPASSAGGGSRSRGGRSGAGGPAGGFPRLHVIVGEAEAAAPDFLEVVRRLQAAGGRELAVHLRLPEASGRRLYEVARRLAEAAREEGGWCVVNGRPDVALAAGAQAVQLGRRALPLEAARRVVGDRLRIGVSVHGVEEAVQAAGGGANYLLLGTIYATPSHPGIAGEGPGLVARVRRAMDRSGAGGVPVVAIGGIDADNLPEVLTAGAAGVAVWRGVWGRSDAVGAALDLLARLGAEGSG